MFKSYAVTHSASEETEFEMHLSPGTKECFREEEKGHYMGLLLCRTV